MTADDAGHAGRPRPCGSSPITSTSSRRTRASRSPTACSRSRDSLAGAAPSAGRPLLPHACRRARLPRGLRRAVRHRPEWLGGPEAGQGIRRAGDRAGPSEAEYDDMPSNAIATGLVDLVLPVAEMPARIADYYQRLRQFDDGSAGGRRRRRGRRAARHPDAAARPHRPRLLQLQARHAPPPHRAADERCRRARRSATTRG